MSSRGSAVVLIVWGVAALLAAGGAFAADEEGCLFCHGLDLRASGPGEDGRDLRVREALGGPHDTLFCSDCHPDARRAPHAAAPGPAQCIGECHGQTAGARESHRRASYGGLSESHRGVSSPEAPCRLCHRATDRPGGKGAVLGRCAGCHPAERTSEERGVHARLAGRAGIDLCAGCHAAHPPAPGGGKATCDGPECHQRATPGMKRLVGHKGGIAGGRASETGVLVGIAAFGWIVGSRLSPPRRKDGGAR